jgi:DNA-directed RNA polymerase specialized sigma24 family protein
MWPDDYVDWALRVRPALDQQLRSQLEARLSERGQSIISIDELVEQARREAFDLAYSHCRHANYFANETEFRVWLTIVAFREVLRLLVRHEELEPWLNRLSAAQRRLLGMVYLDRLPAGDAASLLRLPPEEIARRARETLDDLLQMVRQGEQESEE